MIPHVLYLLMLQKRADTNPPRAADEAEVVSGTRLQ